MENLVGREHSVRVNTKIAKRIWLFFLSGAALWFCISCDAILDEASYEAGNLWSGGADV